MLALSLHISIEDAMRTAALQMMYYMQECGSPSSRRPTSRRPSATATRDAHFVPRAALRRPLAARQAHRGQAHRARSRRQAHREVKHTPRSRQPREPLPRRPAHTRSTTRPRASRACTQDKKICEDIPPQLDLGSRPSFDSAHLDVPSDEFPVISCRTASR